MSTLPYSNTFKIQQLSLKISSVNVCVCVLWGFRVKNVSTYHKTKQYSIFKVSHCHSLYSASSSVYFCFYISLQKLKTTNQKLKEVTFKSAHSAQRLKLFTTEAVPDLHKRRALSLGFSPCHSMRRQNKRGGGKYFGASLTKLFTHELSSTNE